MVIVLCLTPYDHTFVWPLERGYKRCVSGFMGGSALDESKGKQNLLGSLFLANFIPSLTWILTLLAVSIYCPTDL